MNTYVGTRNGCRLFSIPYVSFPFGFGGPRRRTFWISATSPTRSYQSTSSEVFATWSIRSASSVSCFSIAARRCSSVGGGASAAHAGAAPRTPRQRQQRTAGTTADVASVRMARF